MNTIVKTNDRTQIVDQVQLMTEDGKYYHMSDIGDTFECLTQLVIGSEEGQALRDVECPAAAIPWWMPTAAATGPLDMIADSSHINSNDFNDNSTLFSNNNSVMTAYHRPVLTDIVSNDTGADSDLLSIEEFTIDGYTTVYQPGDTATVPNIGTLSITTNGMLTFTPNEGYAGAVPDVTYTMTGGHGDRDKGTIIFNDVSVVSKQSAVAHGNRVKIAHNMPVEIKLLGNNTDLGSDALSVEGFTIEGYTTVYQSGDMATIPNVGIITITNDGTLNFTPNDGYAGAVPDVTYTVIGGNGGIDTAIVTFDDVPAGVAGINFDGTEDIVATAADIIDVANQPTADAFDIDLTDLSLNIQKWSTSSYIPV